MQPCPNNKALASANTLFIIEKGDMNYDHALLMNRKYLMPQVTSFYQVQGLRASANLLSLKACALKTLKTAMVIAEGALCAWVRSCTKTFVSIMSRVSFITCLCFEYMPTPFPYKLS